MQVFNPAYAAENAKLNKHPIYVLEIIWNNGQEGTEGVNDIYFASADIANILNFPFPNRYYPLLQANGVSSISQKVDPINGISSIGSMTFKLSDYNHYVSDIIKAADVAGHGLRRQRCQLFVLYAGKDWADRIKIRTLQVSNLIPDKDGLTYHLSAHDIQRALRKTIFQPTQTTLTAAMSNAALTLSVADASIFIAAPNHVYGTVGFVKLNDEIMMWSSISGSVITIAASGRGMFGTVAANHAVGVDVKEIIVMHENPITIALKVMTSTGLGSNGIYDVLPGHWGCALSSANDVLLSEWERVGQQLVGLDTPLPSDGLQYEFVIDKSTTGKKFIESEILKTIGAFGMVHGDGSYGIRAYSDLANVDKLNAERHLTTDDIISFDSLNHNYDKIVNTMLLSFDESPKLSNKFSRASLFVDQDSRAKWGEAPQLKYKVKGIIPTSIFVDQLYQRFNLIASKFSRPPLSISIIAMPNNHDLEIGDIVRLSLPIHDALTGLDLDRAFEVDDVSLNSETGRVKLHLNAQPEQANIWHSGNGTTTRGNGTMTRFIADIVYQIGTPLVWDGLSNLTLNTGDYWVAGNLTIAFGVTLTINGSVRLFSTGIITIEGTIDGKGKGGLLGGTSGGYSWVTYPSTQGAGIGHVGRGGAGGSRNNYPIVPASPGGQVLSPPPPAPIIIGTAIDPATSRWTAVSGIPRPPLMGSGGGGGGDAANVTRGRGNGGAGGSGLLIMARGIFCTTGMVDLRGAPGDDGKIVPPPLGEVPGGGNGGGGGGSFIALAERDANGLPVLNITSTRVLTSGGAGGAAGYNSYGYASLPGSVGGRGSFVAQVIG